MMSAWAHRLTGVDYGRAAQAYARHRGVHPGVIGELIAAGAIGPETHLLDAGCGTGNYARALRGETGCRVSGVEPSREMREIARSAVAWEMLAEGRAERLPFPDATFDLLITTDVIHHVGDREAFFHEAARVLRPGGRIATVTDSPADIARRRPLSSHFPETVAIELARYPPIEQLRSEMARAGFSEPRIAEVAREYDLSDIQAYRDRAFSSLLLIEDAAFQRGLSRMEADLARGPIPSISLYTIVWGTLPQS